jgi:hypothetical protein
MTATPPPTSSPAPTTPALSPAPTSTATVDGSTQTPPSLPPATATARTGAASPAGLPVLTEGLVSPGTYVMEPGEEGWAECDLPHCAPEPRHARTMHVEVTVPPGWQAFSSSTLLLAPPKSSEGPDGAGLAVGWYVMGLHSDPCLPVAHQTPDILIGPTVDDFVDAVVAHPLLQVTEPVDVELGGYRGRLLTLTTPTDISGCHDWRPWEHGIYAQGPDNVWDMWVIDVDGLRVLVLAERFEDTSAEDSAELQAMVDSLRFIPAP